jgi:hypothetical protein
VRLLLESTLALDCQFNVGHLVGVIARRTSVVGRAWCGCWSLKCRMSYHEFWSFALGIFPAKLVWRVGKPHPTSHSCQPPPSKSGCATVRINFTVSPVDVAAKGALATLVPLARSATRDRALLFTSLCPNQSHWFFTCKYTPRPYRRCRMRSCSTTKTRLLTAMNRIRNNANTQHSRW